MRVIDGNRRLPRNVLLALSAAGWISLLYLAWVVGGDSWDRTQFSLRAMAGALPELDPFSERYRTRPLLTLFHTIPGLLFAILGPIQFMGPVRRRFPVLHRISGRIFVVIGITCGIAAFIMTLRFPIWGMTANLVTSSAFALFMVFAFVTAFRHVKARRFAQHREWMIRGFAAGMSVAFFRVMLSDVLPLMGIANFDIRWNITASISFPITVGIAELWIRATRKRDRTPREAPADAPGTSAAPAGALGVTAAPAAPSAAAP
ncbi:MAG: DUF2306 domain-containing protein [Thioalkalivibrio sp.]|nr:MAG: DUF2306 domain-containing protein [Thioalkalivibrio sp.]